MRASADPPWVALVTGSSRGIGAAIARRLAADGTHVVVHSRTSRDAGEQIADEIGGTYMQADLSLEDEARGLVERCLAEQGRIDVLVNNAGATRLIPHDDLAAATPAVWRELYELNVVAPWVLVEAARSALARTGSGCVLNVTSHAGVRPKGASVPYAASKAALNHVTRLLAAALAPAIRVNAVAPGLVDTELTREMTDAQRVWREHAPMGRAALPTEIADIAAALIANPYVTGEVVVVDGGLNLR